MGSNCSTSGLPKWREIPKPDSTPSNDATTTALATIEGTLIGTVPYMAPEQLEAKPGRCTHGHFAFGAVLFEMATGRRAFTGAIPGSVGGRDSLRLAPCRGEDGSASRHAAWIESSRPAWSLRFR